MREPIHGIWLLRNKSNWVMVTSLFLFPSPPSSGDYLKRHSVHVLILSPSRCLCLPLREELKMLYNRVSFPTPKSWAGLTWNAWQHHYCLQVKAKRHTLILIALKPFVGYKKVRFKNRGKLCWEDTGWFINYSQHKESLKWQLIFALNATSSFLFAPCIIEQLNEYCDKEYGI